MDKVSSLLLFAAAFLFLAPQDLHAQQEAVIFNHEPGPLLAKKLAAWIEEKGFTGNRHETAIANLNQDQLPEIFVRLYKPDGTCSKLEGCQIYILADQGDDLSEIGRLKAHSIRLGDDSSNGVRDLLVNTNPWNDYEYRTFRWDGKSASFEKPGP
jgi:hypothetical protein